MSAYGVYDRNDDVSDDYQIVKRKEISSTNQKSLKTCHDDDCAV